MSVEFAVIDPAPFGVALGASAVGDLDGDGILDLVVTSDNPDGALCWYSSARDWEREVISAGPQWGSLTLHDVNGDGQLEVVVFIWDDPDYRLFWHERNAEGKWCMHLADETGVGAHDLLFTDLDGDGRDELVVTGPAANQVVWYRVPEDPTKLWTRYVVAEGLQVEGAAVADVNGDGRPDIVTARFWFSAPADIETGEWRQYAYAPHFRGCSRVWIRDIDRDGRPDILIAESDYANARMSWFRHPGPKKVRDPWPEHVIDGGTLYNPHAVDFIDISQNGNAALIVGEMGAAFGTTNPNPPRLFLVQDTSGRGEAWEWQLLHSGMGAHEAWVVAGPPQHDWIIVGKSFRNPQVRRWVLRYDPLP